MLNKILNILLSENVFLIFNKIDIIFRINDF